MMNLGFNIPKDRRLRILCLGAHSDDIEIGCGGTILTLLRGSRNVEVRWVVHSAGSVREREARRSAALFLKGTSHQTVTVHNFRESFFPYLGELKEAFERLKEEYSPDLVFSHFREDLHQDHRTVSELTWNTFRNHMILEYEIPKYDGDLGRPNCYVQLDRATCERKIRYLIQCFGSQQNRQWFTAETFQALHRLRGIECRAPGQYAEGFYCRKVVLGDNDRPGVQDDLAKRDQIRSRTQRNARGSAGEGVDGLDCKRVGLSPAF